MRTHAPIVALCAALCGVVAAPAAAQNREHQQMAAELRVLQEQAQQQSIALSQGLAQLAEAIKAINARLDASDAALRKALADQKVIIDGVSTELRVLRERTQDTNARIGTLAEEIEAMRTSLPSLTTQALPADSPDLAAGGIPPVQPQPGASRSGLSPTRLYQVAYSDFASGEFALAISGFENYLREFPRFEQADDAELYMGESYVKLKKYPEAVAAFTRVIQNYASGDKVPEAYFKLGETQRLLNQTEAARTAWQTVVSAYPESPSAILAKQRLDGLPPSPSPQP